MQIPSALLWPCARSGGRAFRRTICRSARRAPRVPSRRRRGRAGDRRLRTQTRAPGRRRRAASTPSPSRPRPSRPACWWRRCARASRPAARVIAIVPDWFAPEGLRRLEMARTLLDTARVAIHVTSAAAAGGDRARQPRVEPRPAAAVRRPARQRAPRPLRPAAPDHVARQRHRPQAPGAEHRPARHEPDARQRVRRLLAPGARGAQGPGRPALGPAAARDAPQPPGRSAPATATRSWITGPVNAALGNLPLVRVEPTPGGQAYWGTGKLVEAVICPADPGGLARELMQSVESWACRWCGELIARSPCPLCGHRARPRRRRPPQQGART